MKTDLRQRLLNRDIDFSNFQVNRPFQPIAIYITWRWRSIDLHGLLPANGSLCLIIVSYNRNDGVYVHLVREICMANISSTYDFELETCVLSGRHFYSELLFFVMCWTKQWYLYSTYVNIFFLFVKILMWKRGTFSLWVALEPHALLFIFSLISKTRS